MMIRVLVADGSALVRKRLKMLFADDRRIELAGSAMNAEIARRKIEMLDPDLMLLDVELLQRDGSTFLRELMQAQPLPVVLMSDLAQSRAPAILEALSLGAVDCVTRPQVGAAAEADDGAGEIVERVFAAAQANLQAPQVTSPPPMEFPRSPVENASDVSVIAIGASTGGTEAIKEVICQLPQTAPGIVISQHIPGSFSRAFAERLDQNTAIIVCEASDGQPILPGHAYLAPGGRHLRIRRNGAGFRCQLDDGPQVNRHRPSVDVMFRSVAEAAGAQAIGVLLTGMGDDGSESLGLLKAAGAMTIAQDEASSVVWGMPGEAVRRGHACLVLPLQQIADKIMRAVSRCR